MKVTINGKSVDFELTCLADVLDHYGLREKMVAAEVDGSIVNREDWQATALCEGMRIELVHFVGGG